MKCLSANTAFTSVKIIQKSMPWSFADPVYKKMKLNLAAPVH